MKETNRKHFRVFQARNEEWYWELLHKGKKIASGGEGFPTKQECLLYIGRVKECVGIASIEDEEPIEVANNLLTTSLKEGEKMRYIRDKVLTLMSEAAASIDTEDYEVCEWGPVEQLVANEYKFLKSIGRELGLDVYIAVSVDGEADEDVVCFGPKEDDDI
jgi:hypothetical protein